MDRNVSQCVECNLWHETCGIWCLNILRVVHICYGVSHVVTLMFCGDGYYWEYDRWIERFHNVLSAICRTKLGKYIVSMDDTLCIFYMVFHMWSL